MTDDLVAYLLDDLSPERRAEVDAKLETDVVWRWELDRLRECMAASGDIEQCVETSAAVPDALESSHVDLEPPVDLVKKTCCFVEDSASGKFKVEKKRCKKKAAFSAATCESGGRSWSLADVTVGAGVLLILAALIMPAVQRSRDAARNSYCMNNMRATYLSTEKYGDRYANAMPVLASNDPAAMFYIELVDAGFLAPADAIQVMTCPNSPQAQRRFQQQGPISIPNREELASLSAADILAAISALNISYALPLGYRDGNGDYRQTKLNSDLDAPLIADAPAVTARGVQPVNHGCRQNVLTKSGSVDVLAASVLGCNDKSLQELHLNDRGDLSAGCSETDVVLAPATFSSDGQLSLSPPRTMQGSYWIIPIGPAVLDKD
ncbi:MAG: hypothetical protein C0485_00510 [Pirellula sp.]|nr:hypothetical protein [Pirellula sp.]